MKDLLIDAALWVLASPVLLVRAGMRASRRWKFLKMAVRPAFRCECGETVSLVGLWRCSCGYTYRGHLLRECPVCGAFPVMARCYACGVTTKLPEPC